MEESIYLSYRCHIDITIIIGCSVKTQKSNCVIEKTGTFGNVAVLATGGLMTVTLFLILGED